MEENRRFSWTDLFIKVILVVIFVLFTVWLLSLSNKGLSNSLDVLTDNIFAQNIEKMKDVGKEYFTIERLPEKIGEVKTLTLKEMYEKKLILEVKDKNGNACNAKDSYVSIEKMENEYQMKVNLECGKEKDYIIVIMGCYNYCDTDICEKKEEVKEIEYEYKKTTGGKWTDYGNWSEWSKVSVTNTDYRQVETKKVNEEYTYNRVVSNTLYKEYGITCPSGYTLNADGTNCYKTITSSDYKNPTCPSRSGYTATRNGFTCTYSKNETVNPTCPSKSGYTVTRNGFTCTYSKNETVNPTCPSKSGYTVTRNGFTCTYSKNVTSTTEYDRVYSHTSTGSYVPADTNDYDYVQIDADYVYNCNTSCSFYWVYTYQVYKKVYKATTVTETGNATCPSGYSQSETKCSKTSTQTENATCPSGYSQSGTKCSKTSTQTENATCPSGYSQSGTKCTKTLTQTENATCPSGYTKSGTKCTKALTQTGNATCPSGYEATDNSCVKTTVDYSYKNIIKNCSTGYSLTEDGTKCSKVEETTVEETGVREVTYYRYRVRQFVGGTTDYKWSKSNNDKNLINAGYKLTGKTR